MEPSREAESGNASAAAAAGDTATSAATSLPKLRLTLRMPSGSQENLSVPTTSEPASATKKGSAGTTGKLAKPRIRAPNKSKVQKPSSGLAVENTTASSDNQAKNDGQAISTLGLPPTRVPEKRELPAQFAEQIQQLKALKKFKTRKWSQNMATIKTISGASLTLPIWAREGTFNHAALEKQPGSRRTSIDGTLALADPTFTCQVEGCKKSFVSKDNLKRHQLVHKKKPNNAIGGSKLQLKLPNLKLTVKTEDAPPTEDRPHDDSVMASELPESELPMVEAQSMLDSQL